jgi:hypothetical protein
VEARCPAGSVCCSARLRDSSEPLVEQSCRLHHLIGHGVFVITTHGKSFRAHAMTQPFEVGSQLLLEQVLPFTFDKEHILGKAYRWNGGRTRSGIYILSPPRDSVCMMLGSAIMAVSFRYSCGSGDLRDST